MMPAQTAVTNRVFIDSSVLIAAAISVKGAARDLLRRGFRGDVELCVSSLVLEESERNLRSKAPEALPDFYIFRHLLVAELVDPPESLVRSVGEAVDWKDAPIIAAAIEARATYLATYDRKHLLSKRQEIRAHFAVTVMTPDQVLRFAVLDEVQARNARVTPEEAEEDAAREIAAHRRSRGTNAESDDAK